MQTEEYPDGSRISKLITAPSDDVLIERLKRERDAAIAAGATSVRQAILDPELACPCGLGRKTKNCCLKRMRSLAANAGLPVPVID